MDSLHDHLNKLLGEMQRHTKDIEEYVREHVSDEPENLEQELDQRILIMKSRMDQQLSSIGKFVAEQAPKKNDPDYQTKAARYRQFLVGATSRLQIMFKRIIALVSKLAEVIVQIAKWIIENLPTIILAIKILFEKVIAPLRDQKSDKK